jgi:hypothetical protein
VGLTLLELILALSLSVVLLFAVGMALRLYWRSFDVKRTNIEQAHLARAILRKMEDDLRTAVQYTPVDLSGLESMTSSSSLAGAFAGMTGTGSPAATAGATGGGAGTGGGSGTGTGGGGRSTAQTSQSGQSAGSATGASANSSTSKTGGSTSTQSGGTSTGGSSTAASGASASDQAATGESAATETTAETPPAVVGLYGSANQLQFDVSRLPRVDEYAGGSPANMVQIPSDIKTLTYYVRSESIGGTTSTFGSAAAPGSSEPSTTGQGRGLMRLEMDRAVSAYSESNGSVSAGYDAAKLLADEVTSITFRYWNGTEWVSDWNSDEMGGLPLAVEVVMTMADPNAVAATGPPVQSFAATTDTSTDASYRIVVNLPTASLPPPAEEPASTEGTEGTAGTSTPGSSGNTTTPGSGGFSAPAMGGSGSAGSSSSGSGSSSYGTGSKTGGS